MSKARELPKDISEDKRQTEYFKTLLVQNKKIDEIKGAQHTQTGNEDKQNEVQGGYHLGYWVNKYPCFKWDHFKTDWHGIRNFKFTSKVDGSCIKTKEIVYQKFKDFKEVKKSTRRNSKASWFLNMGEVEIIQDLYGTDSIDDLPKFEDVLLEESSHDGSLD